MYFFLDYIRHGDSDAPLDANNRSDSLGIQCARELRHATRWNKKAPRICCHVVIVKFLQTISRQWANDPHGHGIRKRRGRCLKRAE